MAVVRVEAGAVVEVYRDVDTVAEARAKYGDRPGTQFVVANQPPGTQFNGGVFTPPVIPPKQRVETREVRAIRALADEIGPAAVARVDAILGPAPSNPVGGP